MSQFWSAIIKLLLRNCSSVLLRILLTLGHWVIYKKPCSWINIGLFWKAALANVFFPNPPNHTFDATQPGVVSCEWKLTPSMSDLTSLSISQSIPTVTENHHVFSKIKSDRGVLVNRFLLVLFTIYGNWRNRRPKRECAVSVTEMRVCWLSHRQKRVVPCQLPLWASRSP